MRVVLAIACLAGLSGCVTREKIPVVTVVEVPIPQGLLRCPDLPKAPDPNVGTQKDVADYLLRLEAAARKCRAAAKAVEDRGTAADDVR